ncbi:MAG: type VI secretion system tip protein VgrG [Bacteroidota bacterium]
MGSSGNTNDFEVKINGSDVKDLYQVSSINTVCEANRIAFATVILRKQAGSAQGWPVSEGDNFIPGNKIELLAGGASGGSSVFTGIIVSQEIRGGFQTPGEMVVRCKDASVKMTIGRKSKYYQNQSDSDIMSAVIGNTSGLSADVDSTEGELKELIQYDCTDWDFLLSRAEVNQMLVFTVAGKVSAKKPSSSSSVATLFGGDDVMEFNAILDATYQLSGAEGDSWDYSSQEMTTETGSEPSLPSAGNLDGSKLADAVGSPSIKLVTTAPYASSALTAWASSALLRSRLSRIRGNIKVSGNADIKPGSVVTLKGFGARFDGEVYVTGVVHDVSNGVWSTTVQMGIDPQWFTEKFPTAAPLAAGLVPGIHGLQNASVKQIDSDPDNETRILVDIPAVDASGDGVWARLATFYATNGAGAFFMPEVGDEVVLGFLNNDPTFPVILGSLYSSKNAPPQTPSSENPIKTFVSKNKLELQFDDENKVLTVQTPGGNKMVLSDQDEGITIEDQNGNSIKMSSSGIEITSASDMTLSATGNFKASGDAGVTVSSDAEVSVQSEATLSVQGLTVSVEGETELSLSGGATASLSGGGELSLSAGMIMLN